MRFAKNCTLQGSRGFWFQWKIGGSGCLGMEELERWKSNARSVEISKLQKDLVRNWKTRNIVLVTVVTLISGYGGGSEEMTYTILQECPRCGKFECEYVETYEAGTLKIKRLHCRSCTLVFDVAHSRR